MMTSGDGRSPEEPRLLMHREMAGDLRLIASLIDMRMTALEDAEGLVALRQVRGLIRSMALAHGTAYEAGTGGMVSARRLMEKLVKSTRLTHCTRTWITTAVDAGAVKIPAASAVPLALAVSELIRESVLRSLDGMAEGSITLTVREDEHRYTITIADSGFGGSDMRGGEEETTIGTIVADHIVHYRLKGTIERQEGDGRTRVITFPKPAGPT
ncbi:hypothetical protein AZH53_08580 [Methanomicrobiaceae archaeon CYW5]|uniref:histidine kinase dimerization/phosphoacceptor domain -containing protein n=1 Tax=Methanovulcanius yangii TaxID=1789227 RepID=UPI0029CA7EFD|nr:histidine kinase dimerization/phosphoacceptor domain -containing protein [Methanovulcanius yangii]MBT8508459.1 hypothetical protein [Methanovulcanius yangii]